MKRSIPVVFLVTLFVGVAAAQQPVINEGPENAASLALTGEPNAGIAQGSMIVVKGQNLGVCGTVVASSFPLKTTMGATSMKITMAGNTFNVLMYYVVACGVGASPQDRIYPDQLSGIVPSNTPVGTGTLTVTNNNQTSASVPITVVATRFGMYTRNGNGTGPAIVQNFNSLPDEPLNSLVESAHPGQIEVLWGNGLGAVSGDDSVPPAGGNVDIPVDVFVGGKPANVAYKGRSVYPSVDLIFFTVPDGVQGCYVPVAVRAAGVLSNVGIISVTPSGKICSDPTGFSTADLQKVANGGTLTVASISLTRESVKLSLTGMGNFQGNLDIAGGRFRQYASAANLLTAVRRGSLGGIDAAFPSVGCEVTPGTFQNFLNSIFLQVADPADLRVQGLDAGAALNLAGPLGAKPIPSKNTGNIAGVVYTPPNAVGGLLGGGIPGLAGLPPVTPDYLAPGAYALDNGSGGAAVGGFHTALTIPSNPPVWTNQDAIGNVPRSQDVTVTWSGGVAGGFVAIVGNSADPVTGAAANFICAAPADAGTFTVPSWVLSALPASGADPSAGGTPVGFLMLGNTLAQPARFQATGVDVGFFTWGALQIKNVNYQ